jgi:type VI secretion system protein ImpE
MNAQELLKAGRLNDAVQALGAELREQPGDARLRTFLFELLCFAGDFERAAKQLNVLSEAGTDRETGVLLYRSAIAAERKRQLFYEGSAGQEGGSGTLEAFGPGIINGRPFRTLADADPRIGARLEIFVAGEFVRLPFEHIGALRIAPPRLLRDLLWPAGEIVAGPAARGREFGEVLLPALYAFSWRHSSEEVRLGRATDWQDADGTGEYPAGQKLLVIDGEDVIPFLEVRELTFGAPAALNAQA